jgi:hypothetical protein
MKRQTDGAVVLAERGGDPGEMSCCRNEARSSGGHRPARFVVDLAHDQTLGLSFRFAIVA